MSVKLMLQQESDTITDSPISIPFEFKNVPDGKEIGDSICITPITVATWFKLKPLLSHISKEDINIIMSRNKENVFDDEIRDLFMKYDELLFEIICIGIHNKQGEMPEWFKDVLRDSCTWEDIYILLNAILFRLKTMSFFNSITVLKAVSPLGEEEIIALQKNKESWTHKAASCS